MENTGNYHLLSKFTRLRKKPQQPLTDLTELYGRIANESIYYLKLEEQEDYKAAFQGWKALNTDVMYQLTLIDHEYPNSQSYSREETSIKSGVRELYHKSLVHLERVKKLYDADQLKYQSLSPKPTGPVPSNYKSHASSQTSSFTKKPQVHHGLHGYSRKMATTLRHPADQASRGTSYSFQSNCSNDSRSNSYRRYNKVNFVPSKPLVKQEVPAKIRDDAFESFEENNIIIDLTQESDEEDDGPCNASPTDDTFDFDVEDFYGNYVNQDDSSKEAARLGAVEQLASIERQVTNLSMSSLPLIPGPPEPVSIGRPSIPINQPPIPIDKLSSSNIKENNACLPRSAPALYKSNSTTVAAISSCGANTQKMKRSGKSNGGVNLEATKSTPNLATRQKNSPSTLIAHPGPKPSAKRTETATTAAQRVLGMTPDHSKRSSSKTNVRQPLKKPVRPTGAKVVQQQPPVKRVVGKALPTKRKKKMQDNPATISNSKPSRINNGKSNSINSTTSASSSSSAASSSSFNGIKDSQNVSAPPAAPAVPAPAPPVIVSADEDVEPGRTNLKEELEDAIIDSLQGVDKTAAKQIFAEIVVHGDEVHWEDIAGLESAKSSLKEAVVYPFLRPDLFRGLREPVRGMLLFGPPGTGKTMLARAVATESHSTFFSISASSLTSKYLGESEKLVRALFAVAKKLSPSIIFVDEIDSIMGSRNNEGENESSRRIKNEFLIQWSSLSAAAAGSNTRNGEKEEDERVLVLAATNLPWSIDEAARRRFVRRQYIPLPEPETRSVQLKRLLSHQKHTLTDEDFIDLLKLTDGFSGSDITSLAKDAAMGPLRELGDKLLLTATESIRSMSLKDFNNSLNYIKPSVSQEGLERYEEWALKFGSSGV